MNELDKAKTLWIQSSRDGLITQAKAFQREVANRIINKWIPTLTAVDGKLGGSRSNLRKVSELDRIAREVTQLRGEELANWYVSRLQRTVSFTETTYATIFSGQPLNTQPAVQRAASNLLFRFGYDGEKFIRGGFIYDLIQANEPIRRIKAEAFRAITSGDSFSEFMKKTKIFVNGQAGVRQGVYESYFRTAAYDSFAQFDRRLNVDAGRELDIKYYLYTSGTVENSRDFCKEREGKVFTIDEIMEWQNLTWKGKNDPYSPLDDLGGYNCMHGVRAIPLEVAAKMGREDARLELQEGNQLGLRAEITQTA